MYYYDLFMQGPGIFIPVLLLSLLITLFGYGAFPIIFSKVRKKQITKRKFTLLCYSINLLVMIVFIAFGSKPSGAPYMLWTWIFFSAGVRVLEKRGKIEYIFKGVDLQNEEFIGEDDNISGNESVDVEKNNNNGGAVDTKIKEEQDLVSINTENGSKKSRKERLAFCKLCGCKIDSETRKCSGCGKQYFRGFTGKKKCKIKTQYCKKCGNLIDSKTKKCTVCGKQYFKGLRIKTLLYLFLIILFVVAIIILSVKLNNANLYKERYNDIYDEYNFYHSKAVIVADDDTNLYHSYTCEDLNTSSFWVYNKEAAKGKGFKPCPNCRIETLYDKKKEQKNINAAETKTTQKQQSVQPVIQNTQPKQSSKRICITTLCENEVSGMSSYCFEHKCYWPDCNFGRNRGGYYCSTHTCNEVGCNNAIIANYKSYCENHTCYYLGCTSGQSFNSVYCLRHK